MSGWQVGTSGCPTCSIPPQTYVIIIDNWSGSQNGYTINFLGTATIIDPTPPPSTTGVTYSCTANTITLTFNEFILCSTVALADYTLTYTPGPTDVSSKLTAAIGSGCVSNRSKSIQFTHDGTMVSGPYTLSIKSTRTLTDVCGNLVNFPGTQSFTYLANLNLTVSPSNTSCTSGSSFTLTASGAPAGETYTLNPGPQSNTTGIFTVSPITTTTYTVSVTYGGCTKTKDITITLVNIAASISPVDPQICSGTTTLTANANINGGACTGCTYLWSTAATTSTISVGAGTYTVTVTSSGGCASNVPSSTVTVSSGGSPGDCMVYYVSPAGGGDGLTKATPTTLAAALTAAECTWSIIKMQVGTYSFTDYVLVKSYVTIEGGYNAAFTTKTSNLSGGVNSTTLRRSNAKDGAGTDTTCTMFRIQSSEDSWRLQDLRIELPGGGSPVITGHAAGSNVDNFGVRLMGAGSTGYNIIRCYIDAGVGSNP